MRQLLLCTLISLVLVSFGRAQRFDDYLNKVLQKVDSYEGVKELKKLTRDNITDHDQVIAGSNAAMLVVRTNQGRCAKLLVQSALQKIGQDRTVPVLFIVKFVTYREGTDQERVASGEKLILYPGFRLSLDLGQVVPKELPADLTFTIEKEEAQTTPVDKAKLFILTKPIAAAKPKKGAKLVVGDTFEPRFFNGKYKLYDDGRRSGILHLKVEKDLIVSGAYYSDRDGKKYEVIGRVGTPAHSISFRIKLPRTEQEFTGWLFTANAKVITGHSMMVKREAGFYAVRIEE